jgi:translation elongation factor EF-4
LIYQLQSQIGSRTQIEEVIGLPADDAIAASAKTGAGMAEILEALVTQLACADRLIARHR